MLFRSELIFGRPGSAELKEFCEEMRQQFLEGSMHPSVQVLFLQLWLGKPKEVIEVQQSTAPLEDFTDQQLADRAMFLASVLPKDDGSGTELH